MYEVIEYRHGITPQDLQDPKKSLSFETVQNNVAAILRNAVLVGHCLWSDLSGNFIFLSFINSILLFIISILIIN
jgi:hypothetical protein